MAQLKGDSTYERPKEAVMPKVGGRSVPILPLVTATSTTLASSTTANQKREMNKNVSLEKLRQEMQTLNDFIILRAVGDPHVESQIVDALSNDCVAAAQVVDPACKTRLRTPNIQRASKQERTSQNNIPVAGWPFRTTSPIGFVVE
jgi:hypothetical protein